MSGAERDVTTAALLLGAAVGVFGVVFGLQASAAGLSVAQACTMSLLVFTGASQFMAVSVLASGGTAAAAVGSALLLAARNGVYGLALAPVLRGRLGTRLVAAHLVIDESTAMATAQPEPALRRRAFWVTGAAVFVFWNLATLAGALGGRLIDDPEAWGLDAMFPAGFLVLLSGHLRTRQGRTAAVLGAAIALVLVPVARPGIPLLAASLATLVGLRNRPALPMGTA